MIGVPRRVVRSDAIPALALGCEAADVMRCANCACLPLTFGGAWRGRQAMLLQIVYIV